MTISPVSNLGSLSVYNFSHAAPGEAAACSGDPSLFFSPRSPLGEFSSPAAACCLETETFPSSPCRHRQAFLGHIAAVLVRVETGIDSRPAGDRCAMAPGRLRAVLDLALAASSSRGQEVRQQRATRTYLPHGRRESNLGCAAHSWRTKDAWLRHFGTDRVALDAESATEFGSGKAMGGLSEQSSGSHRCDGFLYRADARVRHAVLLLYHCA